MSFPSLKDQQPPLVSIYFLRNSTLMLSHPFCNSSLWKAFLWMYNRSVQSVIFQLAPNLLDGVEDFEGASPSFSMFQQVVPALGRFMVIVMVNSTKPLNMPSVLIILASHCINSVYRTLLVFWVLTLSQTSSAPSPFSISWDRSLSTLWWKSWA